MEKLFTNKIIKKSILSAVTLLPLVFLLISLFIKGPDTYNTFWRVIGGNVEFSPSLYILIASGLLLLGSIIVEVIVLLTSKNNLYASVISVAVLVSIIVVGAFGNVLVPGMVICLLMAIIVSLMGILYFVLGIKYDNSDVIETTEFNLKKNYLITLVVNIISTLALLFVFFIPLYSSRNIETDKVTTMLLITGFVGFSDIPSFIVFVIMIFAYIVGAGILLNCFKYYFHHDVRFSSASKLSALYNFVVSIIFFIAGTTVVFVLTINGKYIAGSVSFIPFLIMAFITIVHSFFNAKNEYAQSKKKKAQFIPKSKWLILTFIVLFTTITVVSLLVTIIELKFKTSTAVSVPDPVKITGIDLIINSSKYGDAYKLVSFVVFAVMLISSIMFVLSLASFFTKTGEIKRIGLAAIITNFIFVVGIGLFCKYYEISLSISTESLKTYLTNNYGSYVVSLLDSGTLKTEVSGQAFYLIFVDVALAIGLILLKPFTRTDEGLASGDVEVSNDEDSPLSIQIVNGETPLLDASDDSEITSTDTNSSEKNNEESIEEEEKLNAFDACPAFSELDSLEFMFERQMKERREKLFENPSLPALIRFIVDYARESKKHLSYTPEDIAAFVAGLGATKLSILQGMSGTGKTSLPKIFLEALMGNCEIIEVESSWKDKNELLGYYNEFSKTFTPKKFTRALYKATLNKDVITFIVLDEMNLSRIEYYFSDFLSLMENEPELREIQLLNTKIYNTYDNEKHSYDGLKDDHTLHIPENVWFIGTANRDESTFEISDKVYDRAHTMNFNKRAPKVKNYSVEIDKKFLPYEEFNNLLLNAIQESEFDLESVPYVKSVEDILRPFNISFGNRIMNQIEAYVKIYSQCFPENPEAIDDALERILLSKVVAKLEFKAIEDKNELVRKFEKLNLMMCAEFVGRLNEDF